MLMYFLQQLFTCCVLKNALFGRYGPLVTYLRHKTELGFDITYLGLGDKAGLLAPLSHYTYQISFVGPILPIFVLQLS